MEAEMTLPDGRRVMPNGSARAMAEGEALKMDGEGVDMNPATMSDRKFKEEMKDEELRDEIEGQ